MKIQRMTRQRKIILDELQNTTGHPTATELYQQVRKKLPRISLGTVYRNLNILAEMGQIKKIAHSGCESRFNGDLRDHHHLRCITCGVVIDIHQKLDYDKSELLKDSKDFEIMGFHLEFYGLCRKCKKQ